MAVLPNPHAVSPAQTTPCRRATSPSLSQRKAMSRTPSTHCAKITCPRLQFIRASSCSSLPPTDSMLSNSAPARAELSKSSSIRSQCSPERITGGRANSRLSFGVIRSTVLRPCWRRASSMPASRTCTISRPNAGVAVIGGTVSNSITTPGASNSAARRNALVMISRYCRTTSGMVAPVTSMGGSVKLSSG